MLFLEGTLENITLMQLTALRGGPLGGWNAANATPREVVMEAAIGAIIGGLFSLSLSG